MTDLEARAMTDQPAEPTPGPYKIWGEDEQVPNVPCIEIGRGKIPSPEAKSLCLVQGTLDKRTDEFVLTPEDWANARLFAASWATAAEHDRLVKTGKEFYDAVALGPLDAAATYGPDFDLKEYLNLKTAEFRAALDEARKL